MKENLDAEGLDDVQVEGTGGLGKAARLDNVSPTIEQGFAFLPIGMKPTCSTSSTSSPA
jgi:hypothetical protein